MTLYIRHIDIWPVFVCFHKKFYNFLGDETCRMPFAWDEEDGDTTRSPEIWEGEECISLSKLLDKVRERQYWRGPEEIDEWLYDPEYTMTAILAGLTYSPCLQLQTTVNHSITSTFPVPEHAFEVLGADLTSSDFESTSEIEDWSEKVLITLAAASIAHKETYLDLLNRRQAEAQLSVASLEKDLKISQKAAQSVAYRVEEAKRHILVLGRKRECIHEWWSDKKVGQVIDTYRSPPPGIAWGWLEKSGYVTSYDVDGGQWRQKVRILKHPITGETA